ncbi:MAG: hemerythrin domain-containing protein [Clostridia bacterium]
MSKPAPDLRPIAFWHAEHVYFSHLLDLLRRQLDLFHRGEQPNYALMHDVVSYLHEYSDRFHHPREDEAFRRLAARCPELELPLARLHQEHRVIERTGQALLEQLDAVVDGAMIPRAQVESAAATYLVYYGNHLAKEEEDVLTRAAQVLTSEDWEAVRQAAPAGRDPLFGDQPEERYRELRRQIALET